MVTKIQKEQIQAKCAAYVDHQGSQNAAANSLRGVSSATLSQIANGNWNLIADEMWRSVGAQVGWTPYDWQIVETRDYQIISFLLNDAKHNANVYAITGDAGTGKSATLKTYARENKEVYLISCNEYFNRKYFLEELLRVMGIDGTGMAIAPLMAEAVRNLKKKAAPLIILDEADKLADQVLLFFITLYNALEDHAGIILAATNHLEKKIKAGVRNNKKGYREVYSRLGRKFSRLKGVGYNDVRNICIANGIDKAVEHKEIYEEAEGDLRRVKKEVHRRTLRQAQNTDLNND